ncbi:MAG: N-methyl-L-tryptophan oxidase [Candidatus Eremiobacteraeota bacterium]|nr:N-methyl-L-tryptophan oxidase [Candidatus Eremiobacteraeota bacterium]
MKYDVAVVGLGGMGSAILARCALRGVRAAGIEQFTLGHDLGASTGKSRIIRQAYFEDAAYVPLLLRAYELWRDVERATGTTLMRITGLLLAGSETSEAIVGSQAAAGAYGLDVDVLRTRELRAKFPHLNVRNGEIGVYERAGGIVFPEAAIAAHLALAATHGADTFERAAVQTWDVAGDGTVRLHLGDGTVVQASSAVFALGPWFEREMAVLGVPLVVQRNVQAWFEPETADWNVGQFPPFLIERDNEPVLYGFPDMGDGVKAAFHAFGEATTPDALRRTIGDDDVLPVAHALDAWMPGAAARLVSAKACMYSLTPDRHFIIDKHPRYPNVVICGGFSGHGFKFASVVGEIGAQLALDGATPHPIQFLSLTRFA